jgi:imidazolonepropionase
MNVLIRGARQLVTLRGPAPRRGRQLRELGIIEDGAILIQDGRIHSVGPSRRMENIKEARDAEVFDATGQVVLPGFVDSHTHFVFPAPRLSDFEHRIAASTADALPPAGGGIHSTVLALRQTSPKGLEMRGERWLRHFAAGGTTTVEGKSGYGLTPAAELKSLRVMQKLDGRPLEVVRTFLGAHVPPPGPDLRPDRYLRQVTDEMLPQVAKLRLAEFCDVCCDHGAFTLDQTRQVLEAARRLGLGLKLHAEQHTRTGAAHLGIELGAVSVDHLEQATADDILALGSSHTIATLLPGCAFHTGGAYPPARRLIEAGAPVALATDFNPGTSPTLSMPMVLSLACTHMSMTPAEALSAATINGAAALRRSDRVGSLEPGKYADLAVFDAGDYRELAYYFGMSLSVRVMKRGRWIWPEKAP